MIPVFALLGSGCDKVNDRSFKNNKSEDLPTPSLTQGTSIYRYLAAIGNAYPDGESLTGLCIRQQGFKLELPKQSIKTAHAIDIPVSEEWSETNQIETTRYRTEMVQPPSVNGIVMEPVEEHVPYNVTEEVEVKKRITGNCIGTEYILN